MWVCNIISARGDGLASPPVGRTQSAFGVFAESNEANNATWVDLQLSSRKGATSVKVLRYGPSS